ncbi:unnamed protein product [Polarella glacialis]|uniref:Uncharacterized protein n=1 Tax=Polarella glacialis TaxID=89957 RepID=A0A813G2R0_POLGL|nr:unnamed protein product [Polarella glacialis]
MSSRSATAVALSSRALPRRTPRAAACALQPTQQCNQQQRSLALVAPQRRAFAGRGQNFEGFNPFGAGGFPGGQGQGPPQGDDKFYRLLEVDRSATEADIKSAYKQQAMKHHPDRGGDEAIFKNISKAYEVLSNPQKRQVYDAYGESGLDGAEQGGGGTAGHPGMDPFDLFSQMFGFQAGGGRAQGRRGRPVTPDSRYELQLSLEELYAGTSRSIKFTRDVLCKPCNGQGGTERTQCQRCNGTGFIVSLQQMGPFMRQTQSPCAFCTGKGFTIAAKNLCGTCKGKATVKETKTFSIDVEAGQEDSTEIRFSGQADEAPGHDTGDVVIVVREKSHKTFQRVKESLVMSKKLSLAEALCGFQITTKFLDGEDLVIRSSPGQVVKPGDMMVIQGKGMPRRNSPKRGDLFLQLQVDFPSDMPEQSRAPLAKLLGGTLPPEDNLIETSTAKKLSSRQVEEVRQRWSQHAARGQEEGCVQQ